MNRDELVMDVIDSGYLQKYCSKFLRPWMDREEFEAELYLATVKASRKYLPEKRGMANLCFLVVEIGPDIAYFLGSNPKEADRISRLSPFLQAKEIGKIEAKVAASPPTKKPSSAPAPIQPVAARASGAPAYDTTDPRSIKAMSTSDWIAAERQRQVKAWEAKHGR